MNMTKRFNEQLNKQNVLVTAKGLEIILEFGSIFTTSNYKIMSKFCIPLNNIQRNTLLGKNNCLSGNCFNSISHCCNSRKILIYFILFLQ